MTISIHRFEDTENHMVSFRGYTRANVGHELQFRALAVDPTYARCEPNHLASYSRKAQTTPWSTSGASATFGQPLCAPITMGVFNGEFIVSRPTALNLSIYQARPRRQCICLWSSALLL